MTPHLEQRIMEIAAREGYEPASEYVHAMRLGAMAAIESAIGCVESIAKKKVSHEDHRSLAMSAIERLKAGRNSQPDSWLSIMVAKADIDEVIAEAEHLRALVDNIQEGCTPADAKVLREANHRMTNDFFNTLQKLKAADDERDALRSRVAELESQLPEGMKHCTILFRECEKGHGWLTASNWVQHCCPTCERNKLRADAVRYRWLRSNNVGPSQIEKVSDDRNPPYFTLKCEAELDAAIDAAMTKEQGDEP